MKTKWIFPAFLFISTYLLFSCNKPGNEQDPDDPPVVKDSVLGYTDVNISPTNFQDIDFGGHLKHFLIDSTLYIFSGGNIVYDSKLLKVRMSGQFESIKTIYTTSHTAQILDVAYDTLRGRFLVAGGVKDKSNYIYANPILNVYDMDGNLLVDKYYSWDQADNYFTKIQLLPSDQVALLGYERESNYNYSYHHYFCMILNSSYDSLRRFNLPFDSITSVFHFNYISPVEIEMVGTRQNGNDPVYPDRKIYKLFYMKFYPGGIITEFLDIRDYVYGTGNVLIDDQDPKQITYYETTGMSDSRIFYEKYSFTGSLLGSGYLDILYHNKIQPIYDANSISSIDGGFIVSGQFVKSNSPAAPTFYGNFLIKYDRDMNEKYRLIFNKDIQDIQLWTSSVDETEPDRFLLLSDYSGSFMMTNIIASDTNNNH